MRDGDWHTCHFCGTWVSDGVENDGTRHWLSDCRPDLVTHEPGELCTWSFRKEPGNCYAYQDLDTREWGDQHVHFFKDGAM